MAVSVTTFTDVIAFLVSSSQYLDHDADHDGGHDGGHDGDHDGGGGLHLHQCHCICCEFFIFYVLIYDILIQCTAVMCINF